MELFLFERGIYARDYNCSFYNIDDVPFEQRQHKFLGILFIVLFFVFQIPYIPVMMALRAPKLAAHSCYKLMFFIGLIDVVGLTWSGLVSGVLCLLGTVYCSFPVLNYFLGLGALIIWIAVSDTSLLLALNRCVAMYDFFLCHTLFGGKRIYVWMVFVTAHVMLLTWLCNPVSFNSLYTSWFVNPHAGYYPDPESKYLHPLHYFHNIFVGSSYIFLYMSFLVLYKLKQKRLNVGLADSQRTDPQAEIFMQVLIICSVNFLCAILYIMMQLVVVSNAMIITAELCWLLTHGLPSIVYLVLNQSIRRNALKHVRYLAPGNFHITSSIGP